MLEAKEISRVKYEVYYKPNGKYIGDIIQDVSGEFYYWPENNGGAWASYMLFEVAKLLDEINLSHKEEWRP